MGVTVNRPVMGILLMFAETNEIGVPIPEAVHPMPTLSLDQLKPKAKFITVDGINLKYLLSSILSISIYKYIF
jgi:hypothetical protein